MNSRLPTLSRPMLTLMRWALGFWAVLSVLIVAWGVYGLASGQGWPSSALGTLGLAAFIFAVNAPFLPQILGRAPRDSAKAP